jgi:hypothetical protein
VAIEILNSGGGAEKVKIDGQKVTEKMELQSVSSNFLGLDSIAPTDINNEPVDSNRIYIIDNNSFFALYTLLKILKYYKNGKLIATFTMPEDFPHSLSAYKIFEDNQKNIYCGYNDN